MVAPSGFTTDLFSVVRENLPGRFKQFDLFTTQSGALQDAQDRTTNDPSRTYSVLHPVSKFELIGSSGIVENRTFDTAVDIFHPLRAKGEETTSNPRIRFGFSVNEYFAGSDSETLWNIRNSQGFSASGLIITTGWFADTTPPSGETVTFRCSATPLFPGAAVSGQTSFSGAVTESGIIANTVRITKVIIPVDPARPFFGIKFERLGTQDTYGNSIFTTLHGVNFDTVEQSLIGDPFE